MAVSEFPSNSHKKREKVEEPEPKKIEKITSGEAIRRKKPLGKRFIETFAGGDSPKSVGSHLIFGLMVPAAKDMILDVVVQGFERLLNGESRPTGRRSGSRTGGSNGYTNYTRYSSVGGLGHRDEPRQDLSRRARQIHDFDEIILPSRVEAEAVLDGLFDVILRFEVVSVKDLYELVGITPAYTDDAWGWNNIPDASVARVKGGYLLNLPRPEPLNR